MARSSATSDRAYLKNGSLQGVEEIYRRVLTPCTPGLDNLDRVNRMGVHLKSIHMIPYSSPYRPRTSVSHPRFRTHPVYENIVFPLGSKHEDTDDSRKQTNRSRGQNCQVKSRLPNVPDSSPMTWKPVLPYYAENVKVVPIRERMHRPSSVWTFTNQSSRLEQQIGAFNKCRDLKKTSEIIPHRVDRFYFMSGAPKKIHKRYDVQDEDLLALQNLAKARLRSHTTTPSTRSTPACAPPSLVQSEKTPRKGMQITGGLPVNKESKSEVEKAEDDWSTNQQLVDTNQAATSNTELAQANDSCFSQIELSVKEMDDKSDSSSVTAGWPPVKVIHKGDNSVNPILSSPQEVLKENESIKTAWGNSYIEVQLHGLDDKVRDSCHERKASGKAVENSTEVPSDTDINISQLDNSAQPNLLRSVEFKFPGDGPLTAGSRQVVEVEQSPQDSGPSPRADNSWSPSKVQKRPCVVSKARGSKSATDLGGTPVVNGEACKQQTSANLPLQGSMQNGDSPAKPDQRRHSDPTNKTTAIFTVASDGVKPRKDDVMAMDFSEERRISQAKDSDESDDSDWETASISDWDMRMISGVKSSFFKSDQKLKSLRANTSHLNAHTKSNLSWVTTEVYSFIGPEQRQVFEKHFKALDKNSNGEVSRDELQMRLFENATQKDLDLFVKVFDLNKDKTVDMQEFVTVAALNDKLCGNMTLDESKPLKLDLPKLAYHITAFKEMFDLCDTDGDMSLSIQELMMMITVGVSEEIGTDKSLVDVIVRTVDSDHSGSIEFVEFLSFIPFFLGIFSHLLEKPALIEDIERARCAVRKALKPRNKYRPHFKEKTKDIWVD